jgi:hypothetical protein
MRRSFDSAGCASALALVAALVGLATVPCPTPAQLPPAPEDPRLLDAFLAWDRGEYPVAVRGYLNVLRAPGGEAFTREVAHLTGEVHPVRELAPDGRALAVAPDGALLAFTVTEGEQEVTRLVDLVSGEVVATLPGGDAVLGNDGAVAYLQVIETPQVEAARQELERARAAGGRAAVVRATRELALARARATDVRVRLSPAGPETRVEVEDRALVAATWSRWQPDLWILSLDSAGGAELMRVREGQAAERIALGALPARGVIPTAAGELLVALAPAGVARVRDGRVVGRIDDALQPSLSADGRTVAFLASVSEGISEVRAAAVAGGDVRTLYRSEGELANPATSPDGRHVAFQERVLHDWEIVAVPVDGSGEPIRLTKEIQHDLLPTWVDERTVLAAKGEGRHRRSYLYSLDGGDPVKLFHNNTIRTIAPEYEWAVTPDGSAVAIVAERDGDTVSPERGVYLVDLTSTVAREDVVRRLEGMLAAEEELRAHGREMFAPIADRVREVTERVDVTRIQLAARDLFEMGSKHITRPGNARAIEYYAERLRAYGYQPELQWFEPVPGVRTANVIARIPGTRDPDLVYVASSHFDSVERGPGADDDTSGATALLETARVLADHPMPATIELAFFTGEESGLLGSREYVRRAVAEDARIVGALNNDMVGWANDHRLDNTVRYSNPGIRDVQHAAAMGFSALITYDALYYKSTDAAAYYEAYGDIVAGIGSYPVLGNPHYHQATDRLETVDQRLVAEVARTTVATLMLLASSPARLGGMHAAARPGGVEVSWEPAPESDVERYRLVWERPDGESGEREVPATSGGERVSVTLPALPEGTEVRVKAVNREGMEGWDWAKTSAPRLSPRPASPRPPARRPASPASPTGSSADPPGRR